MLKSTIGICLITLFLLISCNDNSEEPIPITEYFSFDKSYSWTYEIIDISDTSEIFMDFDQSQLSENEEVALLEVFSLDFSAVLAVVGNKQGICLNQLDTSLEEAKANINTLSVECAVLLKYPVQSGDEYSFKYQSAEKEYNYDIRITLETIMVEAGTFEVYKYVINSGSQSQPNVAEVYFNPEVGIIKYYPELRSDSEPSIVFNLIEVN